MSIILAINTASSQTAIAIFDNKSHKIIGENAWPSQNREAETLMPNINILLEKHDKNFQDISQVFCVKGPGSFTGLRVGITVANTIAYLNKCELFGISTFEFWHAVSDLPLVVFAGKGGIYLSLDSSTNAEIVNIEELAQKFQEKNIKKVFGDITPEQKSALGKAEFIETKESFSEIIQKILASRSSLKPVKIIEPLYIKEPGITNSKK